MSPSSAEGSADADKPRIFLVHPDSLYRGLISHILLTAGGFEIAEADGEAALRKLLTSGEPDLIMLGLTLSDAGGIPALKRLREDPQTAAIPVIILAEQKSQQTAREVRQAGAFGSLFKPIDDAAMIMLIRRALERRHPAVGNLPAAAAAPAKAVPARSEKRVPAPSLMTILIVEDAFIMRRILEHTIIRSGNFNIVEAETGTAALRAVAENRPHLILLDINLPDIGGIDLLRRFKADPATADIPVVMCTSRRDIQTVKNAIALGAVDYIVKPIKESTVIGKIRTALGLKTP